MSNTLPLPDYITISSDDISLSTGIIAQEGTSVLPEYAIDIGNITMSTTGSSYYYNTGAGVACASGTITISGTSGYSLGNITASEFNWKQNEWEDCFPDFNRIKAMCEQYPSLRIAYEKFVTTYKLVKDDYDNPKD